MGLIHRIFGNGKEVQAPGGSGTTQFHESEPDAQDSQPSRTSHRDLVQVMLRDTMRKHGIPSDWIECRILSAVTRGGRNGLHVNFVVRKAHDRLITYVFAFQDSFERELARYEPRARSDWLLSLGWEFQGFNADEMPDPHTWAQSGPAPLGPTGRGRSDEEAPKTDDDVQRDLKALFAIRDAALADTARRPSRKSERDDDPPDFQPTQPFDDKPS
ncbi:MAG TPA: hypothetical protein VF522_10565 [Ramlibacter sp.]|uniref:hypothetical protein n=1 Tax=Ramlibacter sp. TaxID=1917967 RepID=UPI002ED2AB40